MQSDPASKMILICILSQDLLPQQNLAKQLKHLCMYSQKVI